MHCPTEELEAALYCPQAGFHLLLVKSYTSYAIQLLPCCCSINLCCVLENRRPHWKPAEHTESFVFSVWNLEVTERLLRGLVLKEALSENRDSPSCR